MASEINFNGDIQFTSDFPLGDRNCSDRQTDVSPLEKDVNSHQLNEFDQFSNLGSSINPLTMLATSACAGFKQPEPPCEIFYRPAPPCNDLFSDKSNPDILNEIIPLINNDEFMDNLFNDGISSQFQSMPINDRQSDYLQSDDHTQCEPFTENPQELQVGKHQISQRKLKSAQQEPTTNLDEPIIKGRWSPAEDRILYEMVTTYGDKNWTFIAGRLKGRHGKQCRERWIHHLNPNVKKSEWSVDEDEIIVESHKKLGSKWTEIAKKMPGRTDNDVKNRWNATLRKYNNSNSLIKSLGSSSRLIAKRRSPKPLWDYIAALHETPELKYEITDAGNVDA